MKYIILLLILLLGTSSFAFFNFGKKKKNKNATQTISQQLEQSPEYQTAVSRLQSLHKLVCELEDANIALANRACTHEEHASETKLFALPYKYSSAQSPCQVVLKFCLDPKYSFEFRTIGSEVSLTIYDSLKKIVFYHSHSATITSYFFNNFMICFAHDGFKNTIKVLDANNP